MARIGGASTERALVRLLAAPRAVREANQSQLSALADVADPRILERVLRDQGLFALLGTRLRELAGESMSDDFTQRVEAECERAQAFGGMLALTTLDVVKRLEHGGVPALPLKGAFLAEALYGDVGMRSSGDIDVLVAPSDLGAAIDVLTRAGYAPPDDPERLNGLPQIHYHLRHKQRIAPPIELHWRIHWYEMEFAGALIERARRGESGVLRPGPADELAACLLFYARDGFQGLRLAVDIATWWDTRGMELPPGGIDAIAREFPALERSLRVAAFVSDRLLGRAVDRPPRETSISAREHLALRIADPWLSRDHDQHFVDRALIDWMLTPPGGHMAFARRQLWLPLEVVADTYHLPVGARAHAQVLRVLHGPKLIIHGLTRTRVDPRSRERPPEGQLTEP